MKLILLLIILLLAACSNKSVYDNIQSHNQKECAKLPLSQYDECMERSSKSYKDYKRERDSV